MMGSEGLQVDKRTAEDSGTVKNCAAGVNNHAFPG
jgi:hypothetical protein